MATKDEWGFHTAKVNCVAWSPDSTLVASGSLDTSIIVWSVEKPNKHLIIKSQSLFSQSTSEPGSSPLSYLLLLVLHPFRHGDVPVDAMTLQCDLEIQTGDAIFKSK